ncbi:MAG: cation:proton antiporter [Prevotella sp.]|nr:cation:proton antiporter [Prevotella sp.]
MLPDISHYFPITDPTLIFFVVLCIILFAPMIMAKLRIPHIIGMVLAGILVGKFGLNILERDSSFELFGKVGVLYIMFLAGLEMNLKDINKKRLQFLIFGLLTFLIPFIIAYFTGIWLLGYSPMASILLACILSSNTLIAYPIVCKYGLQKHPSVMLSVGSSMIALTLSLLVVAAIVGIGGGDNNITFWVLFISKVIAFCVGSAIIIPRITRWFFRHYSDAVMLYIYVMGILFLSAATSEICGLEGIFGAFVAGLIMNRFIPSVSPLMNRIEFIGNAIFIPYFLIGVGMLIDLSVLFHGLDTLWVVFCMVFFGTVGKALAAYGSCLGFKMSLPSGNMMFGLTEAHAAGGIAMTMVGMSLMLPDGTYLVDTNMLNGVVMMILFSCIISSIVVEDSAQKILLSEMNTKEETTTGDDEKIMLPLQHDEDADMLVNVAIMMRNKKLNRGLIGLNVIYDDLESERNKKAGKRILAQAEAVATAADVRMQTQSRLAINIANGIKHAFKENDASEIIMGLHRMRDSNDSFWGAYTQGLISEINNQIIICRILRPLNTMRRIHVAVPSRVEFEPGFYRWIERLARLAGNMGCKIIFHGRQETTDLIEHYLKSKHPVLNAEYDEMYHWKQLTSLAEKVNEDHMLVVITARQGTVSYKPAFEYLPKELTESFPECSLMIIYPDQNGQPQDTMTFTAPQRQEKESAYSTIIKWFEKTFKKK